MTNKTLVSINLARNEDLNSKRFFKYKIKMEEIEKIDFKCLKYYMNFNPNPKDITEQERINKPKGLTDKQEKRLIDLGYIELNLESNNLKYPNRFITTRGYKEFCRLRYIYINKWKLIQIVIYVFFGAISIFALIRTF